MITNITPPKWTIDEAITFIREINPKIRENNYFTGLIGSVLDKGESYHDLDIAIIPLDKEDTLPLVEGIKAFIIGLGAFSLRDSILSEHYGFSNREIYKLILKDNKEIDFFIYDQ